jgi:hypothetical protein
MIKAKGIFKLDGAKRGGFRIYPDQIAIALPEQQPFWTNYTNLAPNSQS